MLLQKKLSLTAIIVSLGLSFGACTDDEPKKPQEPVQPAAAAESAKVVDQENAPKAFVAEAVYFDFDEYAIKADAQGKLDGLGGHLKTNASVSVQIEGHCDERGSQEYNLALGERRANSVKNYLSQLGVDGGKLSTISYGEERPAADGHDESAWGKNRRAEFVINAK